MDMCNGIKFCLLSFIWSCLAINIGAQTTELFSKDQISKFKIRTITLFEYDYVNGKPETKGVKAQIDSFDTFGQRVKQINFRDDGSIMGIASFEYDAKGNKTQILRLVPEKGKFAVAYGVKIRYNSKGDKLLEIGYNGVDSFKNVYNYNKYGKLAEVNFFIKKQLDEKRVFVENTDNQANMKILDGFGSLKYMLRYVYNSAGKVLEETRIEPDNSISQRITYEYDKNNNLVGETKFMKNRMLYKISYIYTNNNQVAEVYKETPGSSKYLINKYIYDENGLLKEEQWREENSNEFSKKVYTYDENGLCKTIDSYYAKYKRQVLSVLVYLYY